MMADVDNDLEEAPATGLSLSNSEFEFLQRINSVCIWMAMEGGEQRIIKRCMDEFQCTGDAAELWLAKAKDYMSAGVIDGIDRSRNMFHMRLTQLYEMSIRNVVKDEMKIITKPFREGGVWVDKKVVELRPKTFDAGAAAIALKVIKEIAQIQGARPMAGGRTHIGTMITQVNHNGQEVQGAQVVQDLSDEALAKMIGAHVLDAAAQPAHEEPANVVIDADVQSEAVEEDDPDFVPDESDSPYQGVEDDG